MPNGIRKTNLFLYTEKSFEINLVIFKHFLKPLDFFFQSNLTETLIFKQIKSRELLWLKRRLEKFHFLNLFPPPDLTPVACIALQNPETLVLYLQVILKETGPEREHDFVKMTESISAKGGNQIQTC